jgi:hypothetical protein
MSRLIPVIYKYRKYPSHIITDIHEYPANFDTKEIFILTRCSLHTEYSYGPREYFSVSDKELELFNELEHNEVFSELFKNLKSHLNLYELLKKYKLIKEFNEFINKFELQDYYFWGIIKNMQFIMEFKHIIEAQKDNIPQLWRNNAWVDEFILFLRRIGGLSYGQPEVLEIHPPFNDYCTSFNQFMDIFKVFYKKVKSISPETNILIENRFGTRYKGGQFLLSTCSDILEFCELLKKTDIKLKIALDYPQLFSAETGTSKDKENWMGSNPLQLVEKIISFNQKLENYRELIGGFHMWGKRKGKSGKWAPHMGNLDTFFCKNNELKHKFLSSVYTTFNDGIDRYFVPEVNSSSSDLHSIVNDMEREGFIFLSKNNYKFYNFDFYGIKIPANNINRRESGVFEKDGWLIQFCFGKEEDKEYMDLYGYHRMTNDRHLRIYEDGTYDESLPALDYFDYNYDPNDPEDVNKKKEKNKRNEIKKILSEKGFFPFPTKFINNFADAININLINNM